MSLIETIILASEKAANIARTCRHDRHLFQLLIREKEGAEANPRFLHDFKTLADVLIQEAIKRDITLKFPALKDSIRGEEVSVFEDIDGEKTEVRILDTEEETSALLRKLLNGDGHAAEVLTEAVYAEVTLEEVNTKKDLPGDSYEADLENLGVWIDPIDSTSEYITGVERRSENGVYWSGLRCVTVLIGIYDKISGKPLMGVINQPFYENLETKKSNPVRWGGKCFWGVKNDSVPKPPPPLKSHVITISTSENLRLRRRLAAVGFTISEAAGAGYKILTVIEGTTDAYLLSKDTTFKWDTCGAQAVLESIGGGLIVYHTALEKGEYIDVNYLEKGDVPVTSDEGDGEEKNRLERFSNAGGLIAYNNFEVMEEILRTLRD